MELRTDPLDACDTFGAQGRPGSVIIQEAQHSVVNEELVAVDSPSIVLGQHPQPVVSMPSVCWSTSRV